MKKFRIIIIAIALTAAAVICGVRWRAWFVNPEPPIWTGDTVSIRFCTPGDSLFAVRSGSLASSAPTTDTLRMLILGDVHSTLEREQYEAIVARHPGITHYAQLGDWMERSYFYYAQMLSHQLQGTGLDTLPLINCPGNHEYFKGLFRTLPPLWTDLFVLPDNGPCDFLRRTYYVDFPYLRYIVIDTNGLRGLRDFTRVVTWLNTVVQSANNPDSPTPHRYVAVMMHHPVLSSADGRFNPGVFSFFYPALRKVDLVLAGHDHNYARRLPFVNLSSVTTKSRPVAEPLLGLLSWQASCEGAFYAILSNANSMLTVDVYTMDGQLVDSFSR